MTGAHPYATAAYAETLRHIGSPLHVPSWRSHVIVRRWNALVTDAAGTYPIACLSDAGDVEQGLDEMRRAGLVSFSGVIDPALAPPLAQLQRAFSMVRPFKEHFVADTRGGTCEATPHHRYEVRRALRRGVEVRSVVLADVLDDWAAMYATLVERCRIASADRFTRASFEALSRCEGLRAFAGYLNGDMVSCHLWFRFEDQVHSHLAASNQRGYATGAAYAVYDHAIRSFDGCIIDLGGAAGLAATDASGLARLKRGFANGTRTVYLVGSVLDDKSYAALCAAAGGSGATEYFPAYRAPRATEVT